MGHRDTEDTESEKRRRKNDEMITNEADVAHEEIRQNDPRHFEWHPPPTSPSFNASDFIVTLFLCLVSSSVLSVSRWPDRFRFTTATQSFTPTTYATQSSRSSTCFTGEYTPSLSPLPASNRSHQTSAFAKPASSISSRSSASDHNRQS